MVPIVMVYYIAILLYILFLWFTIMAPRLALGIAVLKQNREKFVKVFFYGNNTASGKNDVSHM